MLDEMEEDETGVDLKCGGIPHYAPFRHPVPSKSDAKVLSMFGTGFDDLDNADDAVSKKPTPIQDQIVTDEQGRRRFHGAFTGGFSAGYYMTVGSEKGWTPGEFKSSRKERAGAQGRRAEDYMDEEDLGEYGILPRKIKTAQQFSEKREPDKRKLAWEHQELSHEADRLAELIKPVSESMGMKLLAKMGWRAGKGVGPDIKVTKKVPKKKAYGCSLPGEENVQEDSGDEDMFAIPDDFKFVPDDVALVKLEGKHDMHGLGYKGLDSNSLSAVINKQTAFKTDKRQKKGISGQAFGVGAFEEEDADVFGVDDINQYDFSLGGPSTSNIDVHTSISTDFVAGSNKQDARRFFPAPRIPRDFKPKHTPFPCAVSNEITKDQLKTLGQCLRLNPLQRAQLLGEKHSVMTLVNEQDKKRMEEAKKKIDDARKKYQEKEKEDKKKSSTFRDDPKKMKLFDEFIMYLKRGLTMPQPVDMTEWEWERLENEFMKQVPPELKDSLTQARANQRPLAAPHLSTPFAHLLKSKFTTAKTEDDQEDNTAPKGKEHEDKLQAVKMKLFGELTRNKMEWHPHKVLCRRMNIPEPYPDSNVVGVPSLQRAKISGHELMMGLKELPSTRLEVQNRRDYAETSHRLHVKREEERPSPPPPENAIVEAASTESAPEAAAERPPIDLFKSIFAESSDEESETEKTPPAPPALPEPSKREPYKSGNKFENFGRSMPVKVEKDEIKELEVIDLSRNDRTEVVELYGPVMPPQDAHVSALPPTSVIQKFKESGGVSYKSKKRKKHKKDKKKKCKKHKHKSTKKDKKYSSSTEEISSDSEEEWQEKTKK